MGGRIGEEMPRMAKGCREWRMRGCRSGLSRIVVRDMLSLQSLMPAGAGTRRYEKSRVVVWYSESARRILPRPTPTPAGDKPPRYIPLSPPLWIPAFAGMTNGGPD